MLPNQKFRNRISETKKDYAYKPRLFAVDKHFLPIYNEIRKSVQQRRSHAVGELQRKKNLPLFTEESMSRGIIYIMTTAVPGLIKIGKTGSPNFEQRMYTLEQNGYRNVTSLKRFFAIEVDEYDEKEVMLHTIFEKSRVAETELFAVDVNIAAQLLSSFDGNVVYPTAETKAEVFEAATENRQGRLIPDGTYTFQRRKRSDNKTVKATVVIKQGRWILQKDSILGITEDAGVSQMARIQRMNLPIDASGRLSENVDLGECTPSFAGDVVMNQSINGWTEWKDANGNAVDIYRQRNDDDE